MLESARNPKNSPRHPASQGSRLWEYAAGRIFCSSMRFFEAQRPRRLEAPGRPLEAPGSPGSPGGPWRPLEAARSAWKSPHMHEAE